MKKKRVLVAMSGGVDSSVAAALLKEQGYDVIGCTMQVWDYSKTPEKSTCDINGNDTTPSGSNGTCCSSDDVDDARWVCEQLDIPFYILNCEDQFQAQVIDPFIESYLSGETPIPCVNCNTFLKFSHLYKKMKELDCDYLATGHYANIVLDEKGEHLIQTSEDEHKDQTYFLFTLKKEVLPKLLFPVGNMEKPEVRKIAEEKNLVVAKKKDSIGICFIGKSGYKNFFKKHVAEDLFKPGDVILYPENKVLGKHEGLHGYTYGQRKALGVSFSEPLFVKKIDMSNDTLVICREKDLYSSVVEVKDFNFFSDVSVGDEYRVKVRYQHKGSQARVSKKEDGKIELSFFEPQRSITPGQAAVFYKDKVLHGGGWIR